MALKRPVAVIAAALIALAVSAGVAILTRRTTPLETLLLRLPREGRVLARFDLASLRRAGVLKPNALSVEGDYKQFAAATGFHYQQDLDAVLLTYGAREAHMLLRGNFQFGKFQRYAEQNGGKCDGSVCRIKGTTPGVIVGFARIDRQTMAVTSSTNADAIHSLLEDPRVPVPLETPADPVWLLLPKAVLSEQLLPPAATVFATAALECAPAFLALGREQEQLRARLEATCQSTEQAVQAVRELQAATTMLTRVISRETQGADPASLSGMLTKGEFRNEGSRLRGAWPLDPAFVESLLGGSPGK